MFPYWSMLSDYSDSARKGPECRWVSGPFPHGPRGSGLGFWAHSATIYSTYGTAILFSTIMSLSDMEWSDAG